MLLFSTLLSSAYSAESIKALPLWEQGLFVVIFGLIGVFLVLLLFFLTIFIMQKFSDGAVLRKKNKDT